MAFCTCLITLERIIMNKTKMLKKNYEFKKVLSKGKYYSGENIEAFIVENNMDINLLGLAVSTKIGDAVKRNLIKRLIRENYRNIEDYINCGYSIVFLWKKKAQIKNATYDNIKNDMYSIFDKAQMLEKEDF